MIIFKLEDNSNDIQVIKKTDTIVQNSLRANDIFLIYPLAYSGRYATISFERNDGETLNDLIMTPTQKIVDFETQESQVGFYFRFCDKFITAVEGTLKVSIKVFSEEYEGSDIIEKIIATATEMLYVAGSTTNAGTIPTITEAQYNSIMQEIAGLNQPLHVLPDSVDSNAKILNYVHDNDIYTAMTSDRKKIVYRSYNTTLGFEIVGIIGNSITTWRYVPAVEEMYNGLLTITQEAKWEVLFNVLDFGNLKNALPAGDTVENLLIDLRERTAKKDEANEFTQRQTFKNGTRVEGDRIALVGGAKLTIGAFNKETDKTKTIGVATISRDEETGADRGEIHYNDLATFKEILFDLIGNATSEGYGYMSAQDKQRLDTIVSSFNDDDNNNVVDSIKEILQIFNNYPEGATIIEALADKVDKSVYEEFVSATNETLANHQRLIDKNIGDISKLTARTSAIESEQADINTRLDNAQPLRVETRVSALESKTTELERKIDYLDNEIVVENTEQAMLYEIDIPDALLEYSQINEIGGMSYKSENLLNIYDKAQNTMNGITFKCENGVLTLNGKCTESFNIAWDIDLTLSGNYGFNDFVGASNFYGNVIFVNSVSGWEWKANSGALALSGKYIAFAIRIQANENYVYNNLQIKPMLILKNSTPTEFKPYYSGLRNIMVDKVVVKGENLLSIEDKANTTNNGITYSISNGTISCNGTATSGFWNIISTLTLDAGTYYIYDLSGNSIWNRQVGINISGVGNIYNNTFTLTATTSVTLYINIYNGQTFNGIFKPMLVKGNVAPTEYKPYQEINYLNEQIKGIQELVQSEGYELGIGINDNLYNYIDFINKKAVIKVARLDLSGASWSTTSRNRWQCSTITSNIKKPLVSSSKANGISDKYEIDTADSVYLNTSANTIAVDTVGNLFVYNNSTTEQPSGELIYELATPIEIDLSSVLTNVYDSVIRLIPNGYLTLHNTGDFNDFDNLVPISITTQQKKGNI